jgi:HEAT repeat protein
MMNTDHKPRGLKRRLALAALGVALVAAVWMLVASRSMSSYQGKTALEWLAEANTTNQMGAFAAFHAMGSDAAPFLVRQLEKRDSAWDSMWRAVYPKLPVGMQKHLSRPMPELVRWNSAEMMLVNVDARAAMPDLMRLLKAGNDEQQFCAIRAAINFIRPDDTRYVPLLIEKLQSPNLQLRPLAALALGRIGPGAREAIPALTGLLDTQPPERLREWALHALKAIDPKAAAKYEE